MSSLPASTLIPGFQNLRIESYLDASSVALLFYDYLLTFQAEVDFIWPSEWTIIKFLFLLTRYLPFLDVSLVLFYQTKADISIQTCRIIYRLAGWFIVLGITTAEVILVIRTWAIWGRSKKIGLCLGIASISSFVPVMYIEHLFLDSLVFSPHPGPATPGCLITEASPLIAVNFFIVIVFETFLLVLTLVKGVQHYRLAGNRGFVSVLYRDGILFYIYLFTMSLVNLVVIVAAPRELANILAIFQRVLHSTLSARVLIHLREARQREAKAPSLPDLNSLNIGQSGAVVALRHLSFETTKNSVDAAKEIQDRWDGVVLDISR